MQLRSICKSKIHHARVTEANVNYIGSIAIDRELLERVDILPGEKVAVWNVTNGERVETYALPAPAGSREIVVNGAAARRFQAGDTVIIVAFALTDEAITPRMILVDEHNGFVEWLRDNRMPDWAAADLAAPAAEV
ncbi:MAG TPA: aspartate 1-decarboxylase [Armatimonadota bacterium]|nr:aspartate 1-decarboxylase [Armatimonadota bacterium]